MISVRKPFFDLDLEETKKDREDIEEKEIHPEYEEKPIIKSSEEMEESHGGNEVTYSMDSENESGEETEDNKDSTGSNEKNEEMSSVSAEAESSEVSEEMSSKENSESKESENSESDSSETSENSNETENSSNNETSEEMNSESAEASESENSERTENSEVSEEMNNETGEENGECSESSDSVEESNEAESDDREGSNAESEESNEDGKTDEDTESTEDSDKAENTEENSDETENSDEDSESEETDSNEQCNSYQFNTQEVVNLSKAETSVRFYQTEFYRFVETIADDKTKIFDNRASEEFNVRKLMFRAFEKKSLNYYRMQRIKESIVLILDNSGSMDWWAQNLQQLAEIARKRDDVEIFIAPNGWFERKITKTKISDIDHETTIKELCGRKVIYVGDFDGANTAIQLSWCNSVVWVCPESRYRRFKSHDWVHYDESSFRGAFLRVYSLEEMFSAFRRLLAHQYFNNIWIDLHSNEKFEDD